MRNAHVIVTLAAALTMAVNTGACDSGGSGKDKILDGIGPASKKLDEIPTAKPKMTPEELKEARRKAGFKDADEIAAENAKEFEKGAREYIKTRMKEYRAFLADMRANLEDIEKQAAAWAKAKDPQKAFDKWKAKFKDAAKDLTKRYDKMTGNGVEGGNTQAELSKAFRGWEDLKADLSQDIASNERFGAALEEIRKNLDEVEKALEDIDKDENLVINKFYKEGEEGEESGEEGGEGGEGGEGDGGDGGDEEGE